jgi:molybdate transport system substrate-binding protein
LSYAEADRKEESMKKGIRFLILLLIGILLFGCGSKESSKVLTGAVTGTTEEAKTVDKQEIASDSLAGDKAESDETTEVAGEKAEILVAAAASLQNVMGEIQKIYQESNPDTVITYNFGSSGALQEQIEQGAPIDVFFSAAQKQMDTLAEENLIKEETRVDLLENKIVLIVPKDSKLGITSFEDILKASKVGIGDPASVPAGQYSQEVLTNLNLLKEVNKKAVLGKDVTEVLTWVSTGNVDAGIVYSTDAVSSDKVTIVAEAPEGSCSKVIYPAAVIKDTKQEMAASEFVRFLSTKEAKDIFKNYGFLPLN